MKIDWESIFMNKYPVPGASKEDIDDFKKKVNMPLESDEVKQINESQTVPFPSSDPLYVDYVPFDPRKWTLPNKPLPENYLDFLKWSNGGSFFNKERSFDQFIPCQQVREYLIGYDIPEYMPNVFPFALDGCGNVYLFDMRENPTNNEFPILFVQLGNLRFRDAVLVASTFIGACKGTTNPGDIA